MVVAVRDLAGGADTAEQGRRVYEVLSRELSQHQQVIISFAGVETVTSSFINTALAPLFTAISSEEFKRRVRIVEVTRQIADSIRLRLDERTPSFWWGSKRITENELRVPALMAMAARADGYITTAELIDELAATYRPQGDDALLLEGRNDTRFSQIVRNLKSHKGSSTSIFSKGYAVEERDGMRITERGRAYLRSLSREAVS